MGRVEVLKEVLDEQQRLTSDWLRQKCMPNALANQASRHRFTSIEKVAKFVDTRKPAVVVGAGPSLTETLPLIQRARDKVVIYCADVALPILLEAWIVPDLIVNLDPEGHLLERTFAWVDVGIPAGTKCALACPTYTHPRLLELWKGKVFAFNLYTNPPIPAIDEIGRMFPEILRAASCPNVGHFSVNLAYTLQHRSIAWTGIDYCMQMNGRFYASGVLHSEDVFEMPEDYLLSVDNHGKLVHTTANYCVQVESFVEFFERFYHLADCYNLSRGILPFSDDRTEFEEMLTRA